jgi:hypothetical protein
MFPLENRVILNIVFSNAALARDWHYVLFDIEDLKRDKIETYKNCSWNL